MGEKMNKKYFADIKYSKPLKDEFPESEWVYIELTNKEWAKRIIELNLDFARDGSIHEREFGEIYAKNGDGILYPAIHTDMVLERLPQNLKDKDSLPRKLYIAKYVGIYEVSYPSIEIITDKSLPNALAKMLLWVRKDMKNEYTKSKI